MIRVIRVIRVIGRVHLVPGAHLEREWAREDLTHRAHDPLHLVRVRVGAGAGVRDRVGVRIRVRVRVHPKASAAPWCGAWRAVLRSPCYTPG